MLTAGHACLAISTVEFGAVESVSHRWSSKSAWDWVDFVVATSNATPIAITATTTAPIATIAVTITIPITITTAATVALIATAIITFATATTARAIATLV